jgi:hypothetical protein
MEIDWLRLVIGIFAIGFGAYSIFVRGKSTSSRKLNAMKEYWGEEKGAQIHLFAYGMMPIVLGAFMLVKAIKGGF